MKSVGILYAPFQTAVVPEMHRDVLEKMFKSFQSVVIALKVRRVTPTKNAPLDFSAREQMIRAYVGPKQKHVYVVPVVDKKYAADQFTAFESAIKAPFSEGRSGVLYTDPDFATLYKEQGGKLTVETHEFVKIEEMERYGITDAVGELVTDEFRRGLIYGLNSQFPISWPTIDMAIRRVVPGSVCPNVPEEVHYLFGKKPGEKNWRFPGGFKDREDPNFETAVWREGGEEVLKKGVEPQNVFDCPQYITSRNVNDWRYRGEKDGITTLFYAVNYHGTDDQIKAGDDLCDAAWLTLAEVRKQGIEGEHIFLLDALDAYEAKLSTPMHCRVCNTVLTCDCGVPKNTDVYQKIK